MKRRFGENMLPHKTPEGWLETGHGGVFNSGNFSVSVKS
jgi:hypothetical protein